MVMHMSDLPQATAPTLPPENITRGTLLALLILPAGIIVWAIVAAIGYISGIEGLLIALGALALYRVGSGGRIGYAGALRVSIIIVVTLLLSYAAGVIVPNDAAFARAANNGRFFDALFGAMFTGDAVINVLLALVFAVLGVFTVYRTAATQAKEAQAATPPAGT
jgi:hypothetical protein